MSSPAQSLQQVQTLLKAISLRQWLLIGGITLAVGVAVALFAVRQADADYRPLYTSLADEDAGAIVQKLKEKNVPYRLKENGAILVPSAKVAESRLEMASAGLPKTGRIGFELFDKSHFGATDFMEHVNFRRALEGELERSMMAIAGVEGARVHITFPKESVFSENRQPAKASVMLKLRQGTQLPPQGVTAVQYLLASAVDGLEPTKVSVLDMRGNLLGRPKDKSTMDGAEPSEAVIEFQQRVERSLLAKVNSTLEPLLGPDKFRASVVAECDFTSGELSEEIFDPSHSVITTEQRTKESSTVANGGGVPGTSSNLPRPVPHSSSTTGLNRQTDNLSYETSRVVKHTRLPQGGIKQLSASVLVDQSVRWEGPPEHPQRVLVPPSANELKRINDVVAAAIGIRPERGDRLVVETLPFENTLALEPPPAPAPPPPPLWNRLQSDKTVLSILAACLALLMLILGFAAIRRLTPRRAPSMAVTTAAIEAPPTAIAASAAPPALQHVGNTLEEELHKREQANLDHLRAGGSILQRITQEVAEIAVKDPTVCANVLRTWMTEVPEKP